METTASSNEPMTLDSAIALITEPDTPETEEVLEEEVEQPEEDSADESEEIDEDEGDSSEDEYEDEDDDSEDEEQYEDDEDEPDQEEPETYTVKVDGEEVQVTLEDLKRGYSGQQYVQKGMQQAAEARKQAEGVYAELMQERQNLARIIQEAQQGGLTPPKEPPREMLESDPIGYMEAKVKYEDNLRDYQQKMQYAQQQMQAQSQAEERAKTQYMQLEARKLIEKIPELGDAKKASQFRKNLLEGAQQYFGYTPEQVAMVSNHQDLITLDYAVKYAALMAGKEQVKKKVSKAKPVVKAGAKKTASKRKDSQKAFERLKRTRSTDDALSILIDPNLK